MVLDCRWLGVWGAGRVTRLLLRGLAEEPPERPWALWGSPEVESLAWPGAPVVPTGIDPRALFGQRSWFDIPPARLAVFLHQQRPLRKVPAVTVIYDTIPLRHGGSRAERVARRAYLCRVAAVSKTIITISRYSASRIAEDLGVSQDRIRYIPLPLDWEAAARLARRRGAAVQGDLALFVGRFAPHKNLDRLVRAFERTDFRAGGGRLVLAGGAPDEVERVRSSLTPAQSASVDVRGWCEQDELDQLMVAATFLVQPSLEEGFGLPVLEALSCGLPVCVSDGGALPEVTKGAVPSFPATSVEDMARALDRCAATAGDRAEVERVAAAVLAGVPTVGEYAYQFRRVIDENLPPW